MMSVALLLCTVVLISVAGNDLSESAKITFT